MMHEWKSSPDQFFNDHCKIYSKGTSMLDHVRPNTDRYKRLEAIEAALKVRPLKWKEAISIANRTCPGAAGKRLLFIGVGNSCWGIENAAGAHLQAEFFDKNGRISHLEFLGDTTSTNHTSEGTGVQDIRGVEDYQIEQAGSYTEMLKRQIEREYAEGGYKIGWRFLYSPESVLSGAKVALIGQNPGGNKLISSHAGFAMEYGSAYEQELWKHGDAPGEAPLQKQVRQLFALIDEPPERVLAGNLVPFRSPSWDAFPKEQKAKALEFGAGIWKDVIFNASPELVITHGKDVGKVVDDFLGTSNSEIISVGWGDVTGCRSEFEFGVHVNLPHLSRFKIVGRKESEDAIKSLFSGFIAD